LLGQPVIAEGAERSKLMAVIRLAKVTADSGGDEAKALLAVVGAFLHLLGCIHLFSKFFIAFCTLPNPSLAALQCQS